MASFPLSSRFLAVAMAVAAVLSASGVVASPAQSSKLNQWWRPLMAPQSIPISLAVATEFTTPVLITRYGYPAETHTIMTDDGYILNMHRISNPGKPVIYLQHGILSSSADWVVLGPAKALGFLLYNAGYDVWMGNFRGNSYSKAHVTMSPNDRAFWDFSWHEMGMYDIPNMIDYILEATNQKQLVYVAHSQGTTAFLVMASMRPEYNKKVKAFVAMAPIAFLGKVRSMPLKIISKAVDEIEFVMNALGVGEFMPSNQFVTYFTSKICADGSLLQGVCENLLFLIAGYDPEELDTEKLPEIMQNVPAGSSTKQLIHYGQLIKSDEFRMFDLGIFKNVMNYHSFQPPNYPLDKITTYVYLHYADNDLLAVPAGVKRLEGKLINVKLMRRVPHPTYNHLDFLYARDSRKLIYDEVMDSIREVFTNGQ